LRALDLLERVERKMPRVFSGLGGARYAYATEVLLNFVAKHKIVTRSQVLKFFFRDIDDYTFDVVVKTLEAMKVIEVERDPNQHETILRTEIIAEYSTTTWEGAKVRISVSLPKLGRSVTSQMILRDEMLHELRDLHMSEELRMRIEDSRESVARMIMFDFEQKQTRASRTLKWIAENIARQLGDTIYQEMNK
jgi:hypothetical protein